MSFVEDKTEEARDMKRLIVYIKTRFRCLQVVDFNYTERYPNWNSVSKH